MKVRLTSNQQGHTVIFTLVACLVLGIVLMGIMKLANTEGQMTGRSQNWNNAMPIVEAGIEEALTHLKYAPTNRAQNGWSWDAPNNRYIRTRTFQDGYYKVAISTNYNPVITSQGWVRAPGQKDFTIFRTVRVRATNQPLFLAGLEGTTSIQLSGHIRVDSYDSQDPKHSNTNGGYNFATAKSGGDIASYGGPGAIDIGNSHVYGHLKMSPETTYKIGGGSVGDFNWNSGIQPGWQEEVPEMEYPVVTAPTGGKSPTSGKVGNTTYQWVIGDGVYEVPYVTDNVLVTGTNATLVVNGQFSLSGKSTILLDQGATLKIYAKGNDTSFSGQSVINPNTPSTSFMYFGLAQNTSISMSGNSSFNGVIYAPNALVKLSGGGNNGVDFSGAIVAQTLAANGHYNFHYDEATRRLGSRGIVAGSWDELYTGDTL